MHGLTLIETRLDHGIELGYILVLEALKVCKSNFQNFDLQQTPALAV